MSSVGEYKTVEDVISDLNIMIVEAPIPTHIAMILANVVGELEMSKSWIHEDCLELVTNLADMNCSASISDGILTLEDGTQIDLLSTA